MTIETTLVNSTKERYGEETAEAVEKNLKYWASKSNPEENTLLAESLKNYIYPYLAAAEALIDSGMNAEEIKAFIAELINKWTQKQAEL